MVMDDLGWGDLGFFGNPNRDTPHIDRMASEGMVFTDFYSGAPLCSPCKAALLTGRLPIRNGFYTTNAHARNSYTPQEIIGGIVNETLLSELLSEEKHLGHQLQFLPTNHGFHEYFGSTNCHFGPYNNKDTPNIPFFRNGNMIGRYYEDFAITPEGESNITQLLITEAIETLQNFSKTSQSFFLYWAPDSMHGPVYASKYFIGKSPKGRYGDAVREVDDGIGQILETLKSTGLDKNTFVFFLSDNGAALVDKAAAGSNGPLLCGKQTTFEGGMRVPGIAWWPSKIKPGQVTYQTATVMDLFSTILDFANASVPSNKVYDGHSLKQTLLYGKIEDRQVFSIISKPIFFYRGNELFAVRYGFHKLHLWTWTNSIKQFYTGIDFCPGQQVENVTTHEQLNHTANPIMFNLGHDPSERFPLNPASLEYQSKLPIFRQLISDHKMHLDPGIPQLNWCDAAVMHWQPPGCQKLKRCLPKPPSKPYKCDWPH
uniref:Sulfatase N-terminal domain-containing protein n=1 Tax=Strigamia maritima TaxID=126957 RepID=T1J4Y0_STRMM